LEVGISVNPLRVFVLAGEPSGDAHAAQWAEAWLQHEPQSEIRFWGGLSMEKAVGKAPEVGLEHLSVMGFVEVVRALPRMLHLLRKASDFVQEWQPDLVVLVDFQSFNANLAKRLTRAGYRDRGGKVVQYIAPAAWAWKPGRTRALSQNVDLLVPILPFELDFFRERGVRVLFEGNPLVDRFSQPALPASDRPRIALLPGSRRQEVEVLLPLMAEVARLLPQFEFVVAGVPHLAPEVYESFGLPVVYGQTEGLVRSSLGAVVASGTATLEVAMWGVPQVVVYRVHPLSFFLAKRLVRVPYVSLVNLIANRRVVPELLQGDAAPEKIQDAVLELTSEEHRSAQIDAYTEVQNQFGEPGVVMRLAARMQAWVRTGVAPWMLVLLAFLSGNPTLYGQTQQGERLPGLVSVRQFSSGYPSRVLLRPLSGDFALLVKRTEFAGWDTLERALGRVKMSYTVERSGTGLLVSRSGESPLASGIAAVTWVPMEPMRSSASFGLRASGSERRMHGSLVVTPRGGGLLPIAYVPVEDYVAGVVEAEGGTLFHPNYYRVQAIIARTWLMRNQKKHASEGYMVSDGVGSQVFHGLPYGAHASDITSAAWSTRDTVLVDGFGQVIEAVFHANSGGYTSRSEEVWSKPFPYLVAQPDTFSLRCPQTRWTKRVDKESFVRFFATKMGQNPGDASFRQAVLGIVQADERRALFQYGGKTLKLREVREKFGLRSTYFTVEDAEAEVVLRGKGFGHGVGLSQEGAFRMARMGYSVEEILRHYYPGTVLTSTVLGR
jgi:lipid-A-disaccharide synthase